MSSQFLQKTKHPINPSIARIHKELGNNDNSR